MTTSPMQQGPVATSIAAKPTTFHDSARPSPEPLDESEPLDGFQGLVNDINHILGPTSGIDSEDVDVEELKAVMRKYSGPDSDWQKYAFADLSRAYTRNLVDRGNGKSNLLILVWSPGRSSPVHDHANAHCIMRVLTGSLTETVYSWPAQHAASQVGCMTLPTSTSRSPAHTRRPNNNGTNCGQSHELTVQRTTTYDQGEVTYMSDQLGLHRVGNPSKTEVAVSLHLYTPPNAAKHGCHIFDEHTGRKSKVEQHHFYSELGIRTG
ncbi:hypothetical protein LTS14_008236 [Recurvomyces mirabilis]|nr:hypothetical protein LTS14_008236 [Recurvomyces mirabilis]